MNIIKFKKEEKKEEIKCDLHSQAFKYYLLLSKAWGLIKEGLLFILCSG